MTFEEILNQWEARIQRPYGRKRMRKDAKNPTAAAYNAENNQKINPMDYWVRRYGVYDKDAQDSQDPAPLDNQAEKRRLRAMRPQAEIDLHGMTLEEVKQPAKKTKKTEEYNIKNNCTLCKDDYMVCKDSPCFITV